MKRPLPVLPEPENFNMTPMIDIVFQLLIFFMLVMDMSKAQLETLVVPTASKATKDPFEDPTTLVINVMKDGAIKIQGKVFWKAGMADDNKKLEDLFIARKQDPRYQEVKGREDWVKYAILVRADRSTPFEHVQKVLMMASIHGGITRTQLGAKKEVN